MFTANSHNKKVQHSFRPEQELEQMVKASEEEVRLLRMQGMRGGEVQIMSRDVRIRQDSGVSKERESTPARNIESAPELVQNEEVQGMEQKEKEI